MEKKKSAAAARLTAFLCALALLISLSACSAPHTPAVKAADLLENMKAEQVEGKQTNAAFRKSFLSFSSALLCAVSDRADSQENVLISPLSVLSALAMTQNGAAQETLREMENVLGGDLSADELNAYLLGYYQSLSDSEDFALHFAHAIWINTALPAEVRKDFLQTNLNYYDPAIRRAAFDNAALRDINQWADLKTNGMIPRILNKLDEKALMVLLNALCFEAKWAKPFTKGNVRTADFTPENGAKKSITMMYDSVNTYIGEEGFCSGFKKNYAGSRFSFLALLPEEGISLKDFIVQLSADKLTALADSLQSESVELGLPRFSFDFDQDLKDALQAMGMEKAFDPDAADFSRMAETTEKITIGQVIHKTHIDVDSEGTRAAAVTAVIPTLATALAKPPVQVILNRPFVFMLWDNQARLPLFIGAVKDVK